MQSKQSIGLLESGAGLTKFIDYLQQIGYAFSRFRIEFIFLLLVINY